MSQCPKCGTSVDHDFGVVACSGCGVILFVDLDGNLQVSGEVPTVDEAAPESLGEAVQAFVPPVYDAPTEAVDAVTEAVDSSEYPIQFEEAGGVPPEAAPAVDNEALEPAFGQEPAVVDSVSVNEDFAANAFDAPEPSSQGTPSEQLGEVAAIGNSPDEEGHALQYTIRIEGIDSKETRERVFEILSDVRLGLSVRELQNQVVRGSLEIPQLNPVRASVIVGKLRDLPLKLNWRQDVWKSS